MTSASAWSQQLPTGGSVAAGSANIVQPNANTLNINQSTNKAIINWQSFSVGKGGTVNFNQPSSSSATLNRVLGSTPSSIAGTINAPGTVLLVNPNGIAITKDGVINTGSFAASTLDIKNSDFLSGNYKFTGNGASAGVTNAGRINVSDGGFAALLGGQVGNSGVISARLGKVGLGAGELITLDLAGDGFLSVAVPSSQLGNLVDASGALVTNRGKIRANGGTVFLSAATASMMLRDAVNVPGSIRANSVGTRNGRIVINGGAGGRVSVTGRLAANGNKGNGGKIDIAGAAVSVNGTVTASGKAGGSVTVASDDDLAVSGLVAAKGRDGRGGAIDLTGANVTVLGALIDASGSSGGGLVRIGGTFQGGNGDRASALYQAFIGRFGALPDIAAAQTVTVGAGTKINVSATGTGDAGSAIIWSEQTTKFAGAVIGIGGPGGGNGGYVEVSGKQHLALSGAFDLSAATGRFGKVLFDPGSINIQSGGNSYAGADTLNDGYINGLLAAADVIVDTNYGTGANGATGDITLINGAAVSWNAATTLTLNAAHNIVFQSGSSIFTSAGSVVLAAGNNASGTGTVTFLGAGAQVTETGGGNVTAYYNPAAFGTADFNAAGVSGNLTAYMLVNNNGQMNAINSNLGGNYALSTNLNFGTFTGFNVNGYFQPLGDFSGKFDGRNHSINFTVYSNQSASQGLFQSINAAGVVRNLNLTARISSGFYLGGLTGTNNGLIDNVSATVNSVWVFDFNNTYATGSTSGLGTTFIGGLVGINNSSGTISNSMASLTTNGIGGFTGGLVGKNSGTITGSSSTGGAVHPDGAKANNNPTFVFNAGGLVGWNDGTGVITKSWSSAHVIDTGLASLTTKDGGFVGYNEGSISNSYATGQVQGGQIVGGFVGQNLGSITLSFSTGAASANPGSGFAGDVGGFAGWNGIVLNGNVIGALPAASVTLSWTASPVSGTSTPLLRGFAALDGATNANNYFDVTATGQSNAAENQFGQNCTCGATAIPTTAQAYNIGFYSNAFKDGGWFIRNFYTRPIQTALRTTTISTSDQLLAAMQLELVGSWIGGQGAGVVITLARDIDLSIVQSSTMWSSNGWGPIGQTGGQFSATFDGQGHTISNIYINTQTVNETGLFGYSDGTIKNVGLVGGSITGVQNVGSIAANNYGTIQDVYSTVNVTGYNNVGGLVSNNSGTILRSFTTGNVVGHTVPGESQNTGGIAAFNYGTITDAYATGNVDSGRSSNDFAGGIVGFNNGTITNVYFSGTVTNGQAGRSGAIAGDNTEQVWNPGTPPDFLDGHYDTVNHVINNGYWNADNNGSATGTGVGTLNGGGGLSFAQLTNQTNFLSTFAGFDFNTVWSPPNQSGQGSDSTAHTPGLYGPSNIIWLEGNNLTRTYGDSGATPSYTLHGLRTGDPLWLITGLSLTSPVTSTTNVGTYDLSFGSPQATGRNSKAYRFTTSGTETVTQRPLTGSVTITGIDKVYDGNDTASGGAAVLSVANNLVNGDAVTLSALTGTYANPNVVGLETVTLNSVSLNNGNYSLGSLSYTGTGSISPKTVTVALTGTVQKTYDGANVATLAANNYTALSGVVASDVNDVFVNQPVGGTYSDANASASLKTVTVTGIQLTGNQAGNYSIAGSVSGLVGRIDQRPLSGSASITGIDKTYDRTTAASGGSASLTGVANNVVSGDTVLVSAASGTYANANAGPVQTVTVNSISIGNSNYSLGTLSFSGTGTISPRAITVTAATDSKTYDGGTSSTGTPTVTSVNQIIAGDTGNFSQVFASRNVLGPNGSTLIASGSVNDGNGGNNYTINFVTAQSTITPKTLTIAAVTDSKVYDGNTLSNGIPVVASGLVLGDSVNGFTQVFTSKNVQGTNGSTLAVNPGSGTVSDGNNGGNYTLAYQTALGTITPAPLTIAAVTDNRVYDGTTSSSLTPTVTSGQIFSGDAANFAQAYASKNVLGTNGSTINASGFVNDTNGGANYAVQFVSVTGTITPAPLTIAAVTDNRVYDGTTSSSLTPTVASGQIFLGDTASFAQAYASKNVLGTNGSTINASGFVNDTNGGANYAVQFVSAAATITPAPLTIAAVTDSKVYDGTTSSSLTPTIASGQIFLGDTANFVQVYASKNVLGTNGSTINASGFVNDTNGGANYAVQFVSAAATITPAPLTVTAISPNNTRKYDGTTAVYDGVTGSSTNLTPPAITSGQIFAGDTPNFTQVYASKNVLGTNGSTINASGTVNDTNGGANYVVQFVSVAGTIAPAQLLYVANPASRLTGAANPVFSGTVTGFVVGETLSTATTGTLLFTSPADTSSPPGNYAINGSGLTAANYVFDQAAANATALTVNQVATNPTSQANPPSNGQPNSDVNITFQNNNPGGPIPISFTPGPTRTSSNPNDVVTGALTDAGDTGNNGYNYQPISQYDPNQYSQFKLPGYQDQAGEATIFTIIARAISPDHAADYMIDSFWTGTGADWNGATGTNPLAGKVTFSDGAGHDVAPTDANAFPIVVGTTDFGQLLKSGPVMISDGQTPAHWLLATKLTDDGKGIIADDPITGKQVVLSYDAGTKTVGGVAGIYDAKTKGFVSLANAGSDLPAGSGSPTILQGFVPATFFAVAVK